MLRDPQSTGEAGHFGEYARGVVKRYVTKAEVHAACDEAFAPLKFRIRLTGRLIAVARAVPNEGSIEHQQTLELARRIRLFRFLDSTDGYSENATADLIGDARPIAVAVLAEYQQIEAADQIEYAAIGALRRAVKAGGGSASVVHNWQASLDRHLNNWRRLKIVWLRAGDLVPVITPITSPQELARLARTTGAGTQLLLDSLKGHSLAEDAVVRRSANRLLLRDLSNARREAAGWSLRADGFWHHNSRVRRWRTPWQVQGSQLTWRQDEIKATESTLSRVLKPDAPNEIAEPIRARIAFEICEFAARQEVMAEFPELARAAQKAKSSAGVISAMLAATDAHELPPYTYTSEAGQQKANGSVVLVDLIVVLSDGSMSGAPQEWQDELESWDGGVEPGELPSRANTGADWELDHTASHSGSDDQAAPYDRDARFRWLYGKANVERRRLREYLIKMRARRWLHGKAHLELRPANHYSGWKPLPKFAKSLRRYGGFTALWRPARKALGETLSPPWIAKPVKRSKWDAKHALLAREDLSEKAAE